MTRIYSLLFCVLAPFIALCQDLPAGAGILSIDFQKAPTLRFYADTAQALATKTFSVGRNKKGEYIIKNVKQAAWFKPEQLWLDYDIFVIRVDTVSGGWYRVFTDNEKGTSMWIKAGPGKRFVKWATFLVKETTAIGSRGSIEIKAAPDPKSKTIRRAVEKDCFEALEIKGDWMRIRTNTVLDCDESGKPLKSGWIKWKDKGQLAIEFFLTC
jgi:hypothetical protein